MQKKLPCLLTWVKMAMSPLGMSVVPVAGVGDQQVLTAPGGSGVVGKHLGLVEANLYSWSMI